jgi:hypothetical protein
MIDDNPQKRKPGALLCELCGQQPESITFNVERRLRRAVAWPIYAIALVLDFPSDGLGTLAAWIAGDDWL